MSDETTPPPSEHNYSGVPLSMRVAESKPQTTSDWSREQLNDTGRIRKAVDLEEQIHKIDSDIAKIHHTDPNKTRNTEVYNQNRSILANRWRELGIAVGDPQRERQAQSYGFTSFEELNNKALGGNKEARKLKEEIQGKAVTFVNDLLSQERRRRQ